MKQKPSSVGDPDIYLGAKLRLTTLDNGVKAWGMSPSKYVQQAVVNCAKHLSEKLDNKYEIPSGLTTRSHWITNLNLTAVTHSMLNVHHFTSTSLVSCDGWLNSVALILPPRSPSFLPTWLCHVRDIL